MFGKKRRILAIGATIVAVGIPALVLGAGERAFVSGNFFLTVDRVASGLIKSVDGGAISAEVINEPAGPSYYVKKHIGQPKYEDVQLQLGFSNTKGIYDWIKASWNMSYQRKDMRISACNAQMEAQTVRNFTQCLITETTIPAMDGSSKEPAYITLKIAPETIREQPGDGKAVTATNLKYGAAEQKVFLPSNFRLQIDGLDCSKVNRIDSFTVKQTAVTDDIGDARDYMKEPGKLEFPNLKITISEASAESWKQWHKNFVIDGNNDESQEKSGTLTLLSPNLKTELVRIKFHNMGIVSIKPEKSEANADQINRVTVELYVERMEFEYLNKIIS